MNVPIGTIRKHLIYASVKLAWPHTFAFVLSTTPSDSAKAELLKSFQDAGVTLLVGDVADHASLVAALKQVEVAISSVSGGQDEVIALWEKKIGHKFEKEFLNKETVLKLLAELPPHKNIHYGLNYYIFIEDDQRFELDPCTEVEATALYPEVKYTTIDEHLSRFL